MPSGPVRGTGTGGKAVGGGGVLHHLSRSHRMEIYFPFYEKTKSTMNHNSRAKESISRGKKRLKAQIPFTTHWHFAVFALINCSS